MGKMPLEFDIRRSRARVSYCAIFFRQRNSFDEIHKNMMDNFYGLTVVRNLLLWYPDANNAEGHPAVYRMLSRGCRGGFPCLHIPRKAVSELYREKIESLQAEESRLLAQKAAAQSAAAEMVRQAEKDGAALVSQAQEAARRAAADALRQAEAQAETERQAMLDRTEKDCDALRAVAMARMDDAVDYLLEKVVKR